jgi:CBS domain-containing protein
MAEKIRDVMTPNPITLPGSATALDAAKQMRDGNVGTVLVAEGDKVTGILTDRDIVLRAVADGRNPSEVKVVDIATSNPRTVSPDDTADAALNLMREHAVRRIPVCEGGKPVGVITLGDLSDDKDVDKTVEKISAAPPNN